MTHTSGAAVKAGKGTLWMCGRTGDRVRGGRSRTQGTGGRPNLRVNPPDLPECWFSDPRPSSLLLRLFGLGPSATDEELMMVLGPKGRSEIG
jgi:hypothetical protein